MTTAKAAKNRTSPLPPLCEGEIAQIGDTKNNVFRVDMGDGTFRIQLDSLNTPLCGYGNTRRDAAKHLADQLREQARMIDTIEGTMVPTPAPCGNCEIGFRRVGGVHIGSQRLGMIPDTECDAVCAVFNPTEDHYLPWRAYVDGEPLRGKDDEVRRFASKRGAYNAACKAAPKRWHQ